MALRTYYLNKIHEVGDGFWTPNIRIIIHVHNSETTETQKGRDNHCEKSQVRDIKVAKHTAEVANREARFIKHAGDQM